MSAIWGLLKNGFGASTTATPWEMKYSGFPRPRLPHSSAHRRWAAPPAVFSLGNKKPRLVSIHAESTGVTGVFDMRPVLEGSGRDADPCQRQLLGPSVLANRRGGGSASRPSNPLPLEHVGTLTRIIWPLPSPHRNRASPRQGRCCLRSPQASIQWFIR